MDRKTYTFDEAFKASLEYFTGDELAAKVWVNKYALKDGFGNIYEKSPVDMHHRLAKEIARIEKQYPNPLSEEELFNLFDHFRYIIPQGSPMTGIGNDYQIASLSNCFVIGLDGAADSYGAIIRIDEEQVQLMKRRGGVGHDLSHIRPKGSPVKNSALTSTGAASLWRKIIHNAWKSAEPGVLFWDTIIRESVPDSYADLGFRTVSTNPCGEIPLCPYDSCRLLAINLYSYVVNPFTQEAYFDFDLFRKHVILAQRIMDDIIDLESEKIEKILDKVDSDPESMEVKQSERHLWEKIQKKTLLGRRTGVGITAEGDMLAALGLRYGTEEATDFAEKVQKTLALAAYRSSVEMAKERGAFQIYEAKREENNPFISRIREADPELYADMVKYGRRNIACLTIAPTGTTSLMTQTTSGIEPVFLPVYRRRRKVNPNDAEARVDFVDETGDAFEEYIVFHHKFVTWMLANGYSASKKYSQEEVDELVAKSPYYKATSNDVDWLQKVRMQGRIQKWVDHSISVTINLPANVTEDLVNDLYIEAWKCGCKGCTVYRDGSRSGVLLSTDNKKKKDCNCMEPPVIVSTRPRELEADVVRFQNNREKWIAFVGLLNGRPYEIFTGLADDDEGIMLPKNISKGSIIKSYDEDGKKHYDFQFKNKRGYKMTIEGLDGKFNPEFWNYAKLISGVLRYAMPIDQVIKLVQGMELNNESINTWKNGVERALKKYLPNGLEAKGQKCPNCGLETLVYQEGCLICTNCGASRCG